MNITQIESYNLTDAVKFHNQLNPLLWGKTEHLKPEIKDHLLKVAEDFAEFLGVDQDRLKDITVSGSNAAYNYTPSSDIDLHLVVEFPNDNEVYRELFDAKKTIYNSEHNITVKGIPVELYAQATDQVHHSQGIYSLLTDEWVQIPRRRRADIDDVSVRSKYEDFERRAKQAIKSKSAESIDHLLKKIRAMRQAGLDAHGEFGVENLAFKLLRNNGIIEQLRDERRKLRDQELSLRERQPAKPVTYGYGADFVAEVGITPDGTNPTTCMYANEDKQLSDEEILKDFIDFCAKELKLKDMPIIKLRKDPQWSVVNKTFGRYMDAKKMLEVAWGNRHIMDVLRTVGHELTHKHQHERDGDRMGPEAGETGSEWENEANARAGILMRDYARLHPDYFAVGQAHGLHESWKFKPCTLDSIELSNVLHKSYKSLYEQGGDRWYPHRCSNLAQYIIKNQRGLLKENSELKSLFKFQQSLKNVDSRGRVDLQVGKNIAIIQVIPHTADSIIELNGFTTPKKIKDIFTEDNGHIKYVEFVDGSTYPDQHFISAGKGGGELEGTNTLFFPDKKSAEHAVTRIGYSAPEGWKLSTINITESTLQESSGYIPTAAEANDPRFEMALSVDVHPGAIGKAANAFLLDTDSQGHPQELRPDGVVHRMAEAYESYKRNLDESL
jgi:hypothetical protein